jgi:hypothetical protein
MQEITYPIDGTSEELQDITVDSTAGADDVNMITSWYSLNGQDYFLAYTTIPHIPTGLYTITFNPEFGMGVTKIEYEVDDIYLLSGLPYTSIINDLVTFWNSTDKFREFNLKPHRGILLYGETGCGKTSLIYKLIDEIKVFDGIVIQFTDPIAWMRIIPIIHRLENNRPIICFIEDLDKVLEKYGEEKFLLFLDGINSISNIAYVATTNNLAAIPDRIKNRPSRFDKKYEITKPNDIARKEYLKKKIPSTKFKKYKIEKMVEDTKGFTMAHLREFVVSIFIFNNDYEETISTLHNIKNVYSESKFFGRTRT